MHQRLPSFFRAASSNHYGVSDWDSLSVLYVFVTRQCKRSSMSIISTHGIAMPKGLYLTAVFAFFFSTPNLWCNWTDLNEMDTYSLMTAILKIWSELPRAFTSTGWGQKNRFLVSTLNFDRRHLCNGTWCQQSERNLSVHLQGLPTCPQI